MIRVYNEVAPAAVMAACTVDLTFVVTAAKYDWLLLATARGEVVELVPPLAVVAVVGPTRMELASKEVAPPELLSLAA